MLVLNPMEDEITLDMSKSLLRNLKRNLEPVITTVQSRETEINETNYDLYNRYKQEFKDYWLSPGRLPYEFDRMLDIEDNVTFVELNRTEEGESVGLTLDMEELEKERKRLRLVLRNQVSSITTKFIAENLPVEDLILTSTIFYNTDRNRTNGKFNINFDIKGRHNKSSSLIRKIEGYVEGNEFKEILSEIEETIYTLMDLGYFNKEERFKIAEQNKFEIGELELMKLTNFELNLQLI